MSSHAHDRAVDDESTYRNYVLDVRIIETEANGETVYRFEAPDHVGETFEDPSMATLYADVYFDVNGFDEGGVGDRGVPPAIIQAGRDTLVAYFLTQPYTDQWWVASFYGEKTDKIDRYVNRVRKRADEIREGVRDRDFD